MSNEKEDLLRATELKPGEPHLIHSKEELADYSLEAKSHGTSASEAVSSPFINKDIPADGRTETTSLRRKHKGKFS